MEDTLSKVQEAFKAAFGVDPLTITPDTKPDDLPSWDSMGHVELAFSLESVFGVSLDVQDLMDMEDVRKIILILERKRGQVRLEQR